ncbi:MAG: hypothetical protein ACSHYA_02655 [Opitutaceae bacterium]
MKFEIIPLKRIGPIQLGVTRDELRSELESSGLSLSSEEKNMDYFEDNAIQVEYTKGTVSFIGVAADESIELIYMDTDLFDIDSMEAFKLIERGEQGTHEYVDTEFLFPDQIMTLWEADTQYDEKGNESRKVWGQIGLGDSRYLEYCQKLESNQSQ